MLTYSFENLNDMSLYEYIYECIKNDILSGVLTAGEKLPSKRTFAKNHNISVITVENAYGQLMAEGFIYSMPKKGYFVSDIKSLNIGRMSKSDHTDLIKSDNNSLKNNYVTIHDLSRSDTIFADFVNNHTSVSSFPFSQWAKIMRKILTYDNEELLKNPPPGGVSELRIAISEHLKDFRGITVSPEQIIIGAGTEYLYGLLIQLLGRKKIYAVENPGYRKIQKIYEANDVCCLNIPMDKDGIILEALKMSDTDVLQISPSHHFPTGIVTPISRRYGLLEWANEKEGRYIIEDDYDSEFRLQGRPIPALMSIDVSEKVIYFNTFTKSLSSTIRISYMILPMHLLKKFHETLSFYACTVSNFEQYALAAFISDGFFEKHINRMRGYYRNLRDTLLSEIKSSTLSEYVTIKEEDSGLHFLMEIRTLKSDSELKECALKNGINISFLTDYYSEPDNNAMHTAIINYSGLSENDIKEAVTRLARAFSQ